MYADNTHITYSRADFHSMQSSLNRDLSNIHKWLLCKKVTLNTTKTEFMLIGSRQKLSTLSESLEFSIDNVPIKQVSTLNHLGFLLMITWHGIVISTNYPKRLPPTLVPKSELNLLFRQLYCITSTTPWYNPISIIVVLSGGIAAKGFQKNYKNCRIVLLTF